MRSEKEMFDLILETARQDERIRAVILNGSRANPSAPRDFFQDYDVVYMVTDPAPFTRNLDWIRRFGELMILQLPDDMGAPSPPGHGTYAYLMQFMDGNRIDLTICPASRLSSLEEDSLTVVLLDKDGILPAYPPANESGYLPQPPLAKDFDDCCNEFWWVSPYVAKGLWRQELLYALHMLEIVREQLMKVLTWYIGLRTGFAVNPGKMGKYYQRHLDPQLWDLLLQTYAGGTYPQAWEALLASGRLFRSISLPVAAHFGFSYPLEEDEKVSAHLLHVRSLPRDAGEMY